MLGDRREVFAGREQGRRRAGGSCVWQYRPLRRPLYHPDKLTSLGREGTKVRDSLRGWIRMSRKTDDVAIDGSSYYPKSLPTAASHVRAASNRQQWLRAALLLFPVSHNFQHALPLLLRLSLHQLVLTSGISEPLADCSFHTRRFAVLATTRTPSRRGQ
jgi:hypothetical protein